MPAAAYAYAARHRSDCDWHRFFRSSARAIVMGLPLRFNRTVAPASAAREDGGIGTHTSSHTSACTTRPGTSRASKSRSGPNGASRAPTRMSCPHWSSPGANQRRS
jgi:hypothetical protein